MSTTTAAAYLVHQGRTRTAAYVVLVGGLPLALMVASLWHLPAGGPIILILLLWEIVFWNAAWPRVQRAMRHELLFAIDADGVFLGQDNHHPSSMREPWSRIDQVVYFTVSVSMTEGTEYVRYVGISRDDRIVKHCAAAEWHFDIDLAAAATERFGQGATLVEAPRLDSVALRGVRPATIPLPPDWQTRHPGATT